jgi:hypothetical protein
MSTKFDQSLRAIMDTYRKGVREKQAQTGNEAAAAEEFATRWSHYRVTVVDPAMSQIVQALSQQGVESRLNPDPMGMSASIVISTPPIAGGGGFKEVTVKARPDLRDVQLFVPGGKVRQLEMSDVTRDLLEQEVLAVVQASFKAP